MDNISCNGRMLTINGKDFKFNHDISKFIKIDNIIIVLLEYKSTDKNNIFAISNGKIIWQIQSILEVYPDFHQTIYVGIRESEDSNLIVNDFYGYRFIVNPKNGKIIDRTSNVK